MTRLIGRWWRLLAPLIACAPGTAPAAAPSTAAVRLDAVDLFDLANRVADAGRIDQAIQIYDALSRDPDSQIRNEARFRKGQMLAARGRLREAALAYRALLDETPDAARVRVELAALLARIGDEAGARRQLRLAQASVLPPDVAVQVSQFSRALRSAKRLGGSFEVTLAPDTNINRGTQARTLDTVIAPLLLSRDARETSGLGIRLRATGFAKQPVGGHVALVARVSGAGDLYRHDEVNDVLATLVAGAEWRGRGEQVGLTYGPTERWYGGRAFAHILTLNGEWLHQIGRVTQLTASVSRGTIHYARNPLQNGELYDMSIGVERAFSPRTGAALGSTVTRQSARDPSFSSWSFGPFLYGWRDLGRTTVFVTAAGRRLIGDDRNFLFPVRREEWFLSGRTGATFRQWSLHGLSPTIRLGYERNASTVALYAYRRFYGEVGLSRSF